MTRKPLTLARILVSSLVILLSPLAEPAEANTEAIESFNRQLETAARAAILAEFGSGAAICVPEETRSAPLRRGSVNWLISYRCHDSGGKAALTAQVVVNSFTFGHPTISMRRWDGFMVDDVRSEDANDPRSIEWIEAEIYTARVKQRWLRSKRVGESGLHTVWAVAEAKAPFPGLAKDGSDLAIRVEVEVEYRHPDTDSVRPVADQAALAIAEAILGDVVPGTDVPTGEIAFLDANPLYSTDGTRPPESWSREDLLAAAVERKGAVTDGQSRLILRAELSSSERVSFVLTGDMPGEVVPLLNGQTVTRDGKHFSFALYTPPDRFDDASVATKPQSPQIRPERTLGGTLEVRGSTVQVVPANAGPVITERELILGRPPVVLVHGLSSDPVQTWVRTFENGASMVTLLERVGYLPFLVNYQRSNGIPAYDDFMGLAPVDSSFEANRSVVWDSPVDDYTPIPYEVGKTREDAILSEHQIPRDTRIGGISEALTYFRDELGLAATQATVIGHSMGGLLARVWASETYNPDYRAPRNFGAGDIYRLLTINTPHFGSELAELNDALRAADVEGEEMVAWARRMVVNTAVGFFLDPEPGAVRDLRPMSQALLRIGETRLPAFAIATQASASQFGGGETYDPDQIYNSVYSMAGLLFFHNRPLLDAFVQKRFTDWQRAAEGTRMAVDRRGEVPLNWETRDARTAYADTLGDTMDDAAYYWLSRREADLYDEMAATMATMVPFDFGFLSPQMSDPDAPNAELNLISTANLASAVSEVVLGGDLTRSFEAAKTPDFPLAFLQMLHDLVFHHDPMTDGAVRVVSQIGGAPSSRVVTCETRPQILHSYATWDYCVQSQVLFALKWEPELFDPAGFPEAGQPTPRYLPSDVLRDGRVEGELAVRWSGMVPSHADEYLRVADANDAVIVVRPVNPSSTVLLGDVERPAAAKGMNIKGKSSNWGPQVGYIPVDQRYSKIWRMFTNSDVVRNAKIADYNAEVVKSLTGRHPEMPDRTFAVERALTVVTVAHGECAVLTDPDRTDDAEASVVLRCGRDYFDWRNAARNGAASFDASAPLDPLTLDEPTMDRLDANPMMVLADGTTDDHPYLTADYDLLAIGFFRGQDFGRPGPGIEQIPDAFDPLRGFISAEQQALVDQLNEAVRLNAGYTAGDVTQHGPETQYPKSPYVDYPLLVLDPGEVGERGDGSIYLIRQGPLGFRDIHLKRFFTEKTIAGFNLWPNPTSGGWKWEARRPFDPVRGYDPRDAASLLVYVSEAPRPAEDAAEPSQVGDVGPKGDDEIPALAATASADDGPVPLQQDDAASKSFAATADESANAVELTFWNDVKDSGSADALRAYLQTFPNGAFRPLAELRLRQLQGEAEDDFATALFPSWPAQAIDRSPTPVIERIYEDLDAYPYDHLAIPSGGYLVFGNIRRDGEARLPWVARMDNRGEIIWQVSPETREGFVVDAAALPQGGFLLAGISESDAVDRRVAWVLRIDDRGQRLWRRDLAETSETYPWMQIAGSPDGGAYVLTDWFFHPDTGSPEIQRLSPAGDTIWVRSLSDHPRGEANAVQVIGERVLTVLEIVSEDRSSGLGDTAVLAFDQDGTLMQSRRLAQEGESLVAYSLAANVEGGILLSGLSVKGKVNTVRSVALLKLDPDLKPEWRWDQTFGDAFTRPSSGAPSVWPDGRVLLPVYLSRVEIDGVTDATDGDVWLGEFSDTGTLLHEAYIGAYGTEEELYGSAVRPDGAIALTGFTERPQPDGSLKGNAWLMVLSPAGLAGDPRFAVAPFIAACDAAAADPEDSSRPTGIAGVALNDIKNPDAQQICVRAVGYHKRHPRLAYNLARAYDAAGDRSYLAAAWYGAAVQWALEAGSNVNVYAVRRVLALSAVDEDLRPTFDSVVDLLLSHSADASVRQELETRGQLLALANERLAEEEAAAAAMSERVDQLNAQVADLREQLAALQTLLDLAKEQDVAAQAQIAELGRQLNEALARLASEVAQRESLEQAERDRLAGDARGGASNDALMRELNEARSELTETYEAYFMALEHFRELRHQLIEIHRTHADVLWPELRDALREAREAIGAIVRVESTQEKQLRIGISNTAAIGMARDIVEDVLLDLTAGPDPSQKPLPVIIEGAELVIVLE